MSIHSSLRTSGQTKHRSVLKRFERLKTLKEKGEWDDTRSPLGTRKIKMLKLKVKKEKVAAKAEGAEAPKADAKPAAKSAEKKG